METRGSPGRFPWGQTLRQALKTGYLSTIICQGEKSKSGVPSGCSLLDNEPLGLLGRRWYLHVAHYRCFAPHWISSPLCLLGWVEAEGSRAHSPGRTEERASRPLQAQGRLWQCHPSRTVGMPLSCLFLWTLGALVF